ncbi:MAG: polysaccharide pyruvyl transferase family protein [Bacteroidaceae bacterium]|nr:polysaccharide pyruvyl transferase family protein [Bacteroidaceae bacterium]
MKIGILSMQEVKNYGSYLQAFSLKKNIEALGHECDFVNIVPGRQIGAYKQGRFHKLKLLVERLWGWDFVKRFMTIWQFQTRFSKEFLPYLGVKEGPTIDYHDIVVIGSDEVFNCVQKTWFGFSPQLYGEGLNANKVISYAASFGSTTVEKLQKLAIKDEIARMLNKLNQISVRDENSKKTITALIGREPEMHVDPVLIYDYSEYVPQEIHQSDYIIVYSYPNRISDVNEISAIQKFAKKKGLRLVSIGHYFPWCDDVVVPTPFEVLAWFRDAAYIVTDTFHGSIFSIKYNKKFCTIIREMNNQKLTWLLKQFGLESRIITDLYLLENTMEAEIDYQPVNEKIVLETARSMAYLKENI